MSDHEAELKIKVIYKKLEEQEKYVRRIFLKFYNLEVDDISKTDDVIIDVCKIN